MRPWGKTPFRVSDVGQGTWQMERDDRHECVRALEAGIDAGLGHIDTAELYGDGAVEEIVAQAIAGRRDEVFLVSKVLPSNASRKGTILACEQSLERLGTDRLDCYLLHWPGSHPLEDTIAAFEELATAGKIRSYGVSNFDETELSEAVRIAGPGKITCNQVLYHLGERAIEHAVIPFCEANDITVVAYSPFGSGALDCDAPALRAVADRHEVSTHQIALSFLLARRSVFVIPKASRTGHVVDNAHAAFIDLTDEDRAELDAAFPLGPRVPGVPTL